MDDSDAWWSAALAVAPPSTTISAAAARTMGWQLLRDELAARGTVERLASGQGFVLTRGQVRAAGVCDAEVRRHVRAHQWTVPHRGVICPLPVTSDGRPDASSEEITIAAAALTRPGHVVSHHSAALLHQVATLRRSSRVRLTTASVTRAGIWQSCHVHAAGLPPPERTAWFGVPVTTPARTVVDIARIGGVAAGLVSADSACHEGLTSPADLAASVRRARRRPGVVNANRVAQLAIGGAESPLESLTRLSIVDGGIVAPFVVQAQVNTHRGTFRVDLLFDAHRVVVEADGRIKYTDRDALWREKLRQEAIERAGFVVVRVTWDDVVHHPEQMLERIQRALGRSTLGTLRPGNVSADGPDEARVGA